MSGWHLFTWLGDSALLLPCAALAALWLLVPRATRPDGWLWALCFGATGLLVALTKALFLGWGIGSAALDFTGISGHTALSTCFWPVALWLAGSRGTHRLRVGLAAAGWLLGAMIGVSRLALHAHSLSEVAAGFLLGGSASLLFLVRQRRWPHPRIHAWAVLATLLAPLLVVEPGWRAPTHDFVAWLAVEAAGHDRPYTRADLRHGTHPAPRRK
ncbi:MAG: phosphatase PAP2 family protein [Xenophilus sp.]